MINYWNYSSAGAQDLLHYLIQGWFTAFDPYLGVIFVMAVVALAPLETVLVEYC